VERLRQRFVPAGLAAAWTERPRLGGRRKLKGKQEAFCIALARSTPPEDRPRWTMQLLADKLVELRIVEATSEETGRRTLKKLYATFAPVAACRILRQLDFRYTPQHGSWLTMAEIEFAVLSTPCLAQRLPHQQRVKRAVTAWKTRWNAEKATVNRRFTTSKARRSLERLYPL
jgi:Homeodomain-like domain